MRYLLRYVLPVALFLAFVFALPAPERLPGHLGLAQVISADPTACLAGCQLQMQQGVQQCASAADSASSCHQALVETMSACRENCMRPVALPEPVRPVVPAARPTITTSPYAETESVNLAGCQQVCTSLGNTYGNTCLAAGRTREQCQQLFNIFTDSCNRMSCQFKPPTVSPLLVGKVMSCLGSCGGESGRYTYSLCRKELSTSACAQSFATTVNQCLPGSCNPIVGSTAYVPSREMFEAVMGVDNSTSPTTANPPSTDAETIPVVAVEVACTRTCPVRAQQAFEGCKNANGTEAQCVETRNRIHAECLRSLNCAPATTLVPSYNPLPTHPADSGVGGRPNIDSPVPSILDAPLADTSTGDAASPFSSPTIAQVIWETVTNFFGGIFGDNDDTETVVKDVCINRPDDISIMNLVSSGAIKGEYYHGGSCAVAASKANEACVSAARTALNKLVIERCVMLCRPTATKQCASSPITSNVLIKGCDVASPSSGVGIMQPSSQASGVWVPGGQGGGGGSNGFCTAQSVTKSITADFDCRCGGNTGLVSGTEEFDLSEAIPGYVDDSRTGQNIPTTSGYFIVEVWTAERCGSACDAYSNIEKKPDGTAYYLTAGTPLTKSSPVTAAIKQAYESGKIMGKDIRVVHYHGNGQDLYPDPKGDGTKMLKIWGEVPKVLITEYDGGKEVATSGSFSPNARGGIDSIIQAIVNLE